MALPDICSAVMCTAGGDMVTPAAVYNVQLICFKQLRLGSLAGGTASTAAAGFKA